MGFPGAITGPLIVWAGIEGRRKADSRFRASFAAIVVVLGVITTIVGVMLSNAVIAEPGSFDELR